MWTSESNTVAGITILHVFLYFLQCTGARNETVCIDDQVNFPNLTLTCENNGIVSVEYIGYYNGSNCKEAMAATTTCTEPLTNSRTELKPYCNSRGTCTVSVPNAAEECTGSVRSEVVYKCIDAPVTDICDDIRLLFNPIGILLSSFKYPELFPLELSKQCHCVINGSEITSINILELMTSTGEESLLDIKYGEQTYSNFTSPIYNKFIQNSHSNTVEIMFEHRHDRPTRLLIEIKGNGFLTGLCNSTTSPQSTTSAAISPVSITGSSLATTDYSTTATRVSEASTSIGITSDVIHVTDDAFTASTIKSRNGASTTTQVPEATVSSITTDATASVLPVRGNDSSITVPIILGSIAAVLILLAILILVIVWRMQCIRKITSRFPGMNYTSDLDNSSTDTVHTGSEEVLDNPNNTTEVNDSLDDGGPVYAVVRKNGPRLPALSTTASDADFDKNNPTNMIIMENELYLPYNFMNMDTSNISNSNSYRIPRASISKT